MSFDQGEHSDTVNLPLILLARHRKKHYNIINDPSAVYKRPLHDAKHRKHDVELRQLRLNEDAKVEEHGDDEKDNGDDHDGADHDHIDIDNASLIHSKSISRNNSNHADSYSFGMNHRSMESGKEKAFSLFLSDDEFESVLSLYNLSGPLETNDLRSIFGPLMKRIHKKIEYQWESNHAEVNKQILDRFWSSKFDQEHEATKNCKKWLDSLREKIPSGQYPVETANTTFNQVIVAPMSSNLGHIVKTRKRQSTIDPFRAQQAMKQYKQSLSQHSEPSSSHLHSQSAHSQSQHHQSQYHQSQQQHAMDLDD